MLEIHRRLTPSTLLLLTCCCPAGSCVAFLSRNHPSSSHHRCNNILPESLDKTCCRRPSVNDASCFRTRITLPQDRDSIINIYLETDDEIRTSKESQVDYYRFVPEHEREAKINRRTPQRTKARATPKEQPAWILHFSAAQQHVDQLKRKIQSIINEPLVECTGAGLILLSSILVAVTTLKDAPHELLAPIEGVQEGLASVFLAEFLTRWFSCTEKQGRYVTQPLVLVDVVVVVLPLLLPLLDTAFFPDWLSGQSGLINLRLLRVLRLQRVLQDEMSFSSFLSAIQPMSNRSSSVIVQQWELQLARVILSIFTLLSVAAGLIYTSEHSVNPNIDDYFTALYFTLTTLTTVGFGDITPMTWQGKLVVSGSILAGITIIPAQAASLVEALLQRGEEQEKEQRKAMEDRRMLQQSTTSTATGPRKELESSSANIEASLKVAKKCPTCKVGLHWSHATYCYNCASPLYQDSTLVLPD